MRLVFSIILFLVTLIVFVYIADEMVLEKENKLDTSALAVVNSHRSPAADSFFEKATFFGSSSFLLPAYVIMTILLFWQKKKPLAWDVVIIGLTSTVVLHLLKEIFKRKRPLDPVINHVTGFSFPSGHSFSSFTFYLLLAYILWQIKMAPIYKVAITVLLFFVAVTISYSRVYLHVHYPSDVVAGFCLAMIWLLISFTFLRKKAGDFSFNRKRKM